MAGVAGYCLEVFGPFNRIKIEIGFIDMDHHSHHFPGLFLHGLLIRSVIEAVREILQGNMTKFAVDSQRGIIGFHNAVQPCVTDIRWKDLEVFVRRRNG